MPLKITWVEDNKFLLAMAFVLALLVYGVELGSFTLSIDEEVAAYEPDSWRVWLSQGRWGMSLLLKLLPNFTYIPFLATLLFCILLSASSVYFSRLLFTDWKEAAVFVALFVAAPVWLHVAEFNTLSWGIGVGLAVCAYAAGLFRQHKTSTWILASLCAGFATAIYQAFVIFYAMFLLMLLIKDWHGKLQADGNALRFSAMCLQLLGIASSLVVAVVFYVVVQKVLAYFVHTQMTYVDTFVHVNDYLEKPVETLASAGHKIYRLASGSDRSYLGWGWAILLLPWLGCLYCLRFAVTQLGRPLLLLVFSSAALLIVAATFSLVMLAAGSLPLRALIGVPLLCAALGTLGFRFLNRWPVARFAIIAYSILVSIWLASFLFGLDNLARQRDLVMATKISTEINRVAPANTRVVPVVFVGEWAHEHVQGVTTIEIFGTSFFQQDGGNPYRIAMFMRLAGNTNVEPRTVHSIKPFMSQIDAMPSWPSTGSVVRVNDMVVVKLSALSSQQRAELGL
ncbi:MAG: glucosyltransferase domain-containing protein [Arenimonas sp.]